MNLVSEQWFVMLDDRQYGLVILNDGQQWSRANKIQHEDKATISHLIMMAT